jgi:hypothetical protein
MRRLALALVLSLLATVASAQTVNFEILGTANSAVTVANTTTATALFSFQIPPRIFGNFERPIYGADALHVRGLGTITTDNTLTPISGQPVNIGCNYGGSTASITLLNASTQAAISNGLSASPIILDVWLRTSSTQAPILSGRLMIPGASATSVNGGVTKAANVWAAQTTGTTNVGALQTLTCIWQWASAATTNSVTLTHAIAVVGD